MIEKVKSVSQALIFPNTKWIILCDLLSFISLTYIFTQNLNYTILANLLYWLSAYSLLITIIKLYNLSAGIRSMVYRNYHISKYYTDIQFRMNVKLNASLLINISYAVLKLIIGCIYQSIWEIHLGIYYLIICIVRMILLRQVHYNEIGDDQRREYKIYLLCSYFILMLNIVLSGVVLLMVWRNYTYQYPGYMIYLAAMYTFYTLISAIYNILKLRRYHSPLINSINIISFITALVSILALQTAMLTQFGTEGILAKQTANGITGTIICTIIFSISISMMIYAKKEVKKPL